MNGSYLALALVLATVGVIVATATALLMARIVLHPVRMSDGRALWLLQRLGPADLGMDYKEIEFLVQDMQKGRGQRLRIAGWWMGCQQSQGRCVVLLHGYADAKVGAIAWAPMFHALGVNVLAIDLRAHGQSGGIHSTAGFYERHDVAQVIDQLRAMRPHEAEQVVLFGVSMGAAVAAAAAMLNGNSQGAGRIAGVIMECPFADYSKAIAAHARVLGMPGVFLQRLAVALAQRLSGADFAAVRPVDLVAKVPCPLLIIRSEADLFVSEQDARAIEAAAAGRTGELGCTIYWRASNAHHIVALYEDPRLYQQRIGQFLENVWRSSERTITVRGQ